MLGLNPPQKTSNDEINTRRTPLPQCLPRFAIWDITEKGEVGFIPPPGWLHQLPPLHELIAKFWLIERRYILLFTLDPVGNLLESQFRR